jgi:TonB family protein
MIGRQLVPRDVRPVPENAGRPALRPFTLLDDRQIIPGNLQGGPLETRTSIPAHLPLDVLATRMIVPRDTPAAVLDAANLRPDYSPATSLDYRVTVPPALPPGILEPKGVMLAQDLPDVLPPDVITTGEVNLMIEPVEHPTIEWNWVARAGSLMAHVAVLVLVIFQSRLLPYKAPSQEQIDIARQQLSFIYMPPDVRGLPPPAPKPPEPQIRIDPRMIRELDSIDETAIQPRLGPRGPEPEAPALEEARPEPAPVTPPAPRPQPTPPPRSVEPIRPRAPESATEDRGLLLPRLSSPGRALEESAQQAMRGANSSHQFEDAVGGRPPDVGGGGGQGYLGGNVEMLTPTEGVDFTNYLARVVASVKRNWYTVMPESARLGERGRVMLQFRILRDGLVPDGEPSLTNSSTKEPLDRAAIASIRVSSPFPPLPGAFSGPYIELRFIFLYNLPLTYQ